MGLGKGKLEDQARYPVRESGKGSHMRRSEKISVVRVLRVSGATA